MKTPTTPRGPDAVEGIQPRVVIFEEGPDARVEVLELPAGTRLGEVFRHCGHTWKITATRTHARVLFAEPT